jgi:transposase-like protein
MVSFKQLLARKLFGVHSVPSKTQVEIQRAYTGLGAEFGQRITYADITFALKREPVAHRIVFTVAHDIFDNWFEVEPLEESVDKEKFNEAVQKVLIELNAKEVFTQAAVYERAYGWSIMVLGYKDKAPSLKEPVLVPEKIVDLEAYSPPMITSVEVDKNRESPRFGLPQIYKVKISDTDEEEIHHSRVIHFATRKLEPGYKGISVLEPVWDDLTVLRNIRWGMGQTMYRYGSGFPVVTVKGAAKEQIEEYKREWGPLTAQTSMWADENTTIEFKGLAGRALNPEPYYVPIMENISAGTSIPLAILRGAQAGQLAGSEVNEREYFKLISDCQSRYEPGIMELIDRLMETTQIPDVHYRIKWLGGFEINPRDQAATELDKTRSLQIKTNWMTVNELRKAEGLDPIPGGDVVLELLKLQAGGQPLQASIVKQTSKRKLQLEKKYGKPWDRLLTERINRGDSVNKICRDLGISTDTFYRWMEELKENKQPVVVYAKPQGKPQPQKEQQADPTNLIPLLVEAIDTRISQRLEALQSPRKRRITRILTDEDGKKLIEETIVETEL